MTPRQELHLASPPDLDVSSARGPLEAAADALIAASRDAIQRSASGGPRRSLPRRDAVATAVTDLRASLFPWHQGPGALAPQELAETVRASLGRGIASLREQVFAALHLACPRTGEDCAPCARRAESIVERFAARLPTIRALLETDAWAAYEGDPAATSPDEAVFCYPGMLAIIHHRIAHELHELGVPLVPRLIAALAHASTGVDIHPAARIGASFFVDHGTGVVIGETCVIGERVRIYQGVTLGARHFPVDAQGRPLRGIPRHPIVEDDVVIYAGATLLGRITIGRGSSIGGNVWVTRSLPPRTHVSQVPFRHDVFDNGPGI